MTKFFIHIQTSGFYQDDFHSKNQIPIDAVEVSKEYRDELYEGQSNGKVIAADKNGYPVLQDPPAPTEDQLREQANAKARAYLAETDWYVIRYTETAVEVPADITTKRAEARASIK